MTARAAAPALGAPSAGVTRYGPAPVENPALGEVFAHAPGRTPEQLDAVLDDAARAFPGWAATPFDARLPVGAFAVVGGGTELGARLTVHPAV
ncbi:aldehyde dehydrogenase family protein, partial [Streptomyces sp. 4503]